MTRQAAFLLLGAGLLGSCGWEVFKSFKTDSVWTRGGPRISRSVKPAIFWTNVLVTMGFAAIGLGLIVRGALKF
jgi:hypothetical protein